MTETSRRKLVRQLMDLQLTSTEAEEIVDAHWGEIQQLMANTFSSIIRLIVVDMAKAIHRRAQP